VKPPVYRIFGEPKGVMLVLQIRHAETRELIDPTELQAFRATVAIRTPWLFDLRAGSKLLITGEAARVMVQAGTLEPIEEPPLIPFGQAATTQTKDLRG